MWPTTLPACDVLVWPTTQPQLVLSAAAANPIVISIRTDYGNDRTKARQQIRQAVCECLSLLLDRSVFPTDLQSIPGQPLRLHGSDIGLSLSHEAGCSVAAINLQGAVGVDLQRGSTPADFFPDWAAVAADYLAPELVLQLQQASEIARPLLFAMAWSRTEAELKCRGQALQERRKLAALQHAPYRYWSLNLPDGLVGTLVTLVPD